MPRSLSDLYAPDEMSDASQEPMYAGEQYAFNPQNLAKYGMKLIGGVSREERAAELAEAARLRLNPPKTGPKLSIKGELPEAAPAAEEELELRPYRPIPKEEGGVGTMAASPKELADIKRLVQEIVAAGNEELTKQMFRDL